MKGKWLVVLGLAAGRKCARWIDNWELNPLLRLEFSNVLSVTNILTYKLSCESRAEFTILIILSEDFELFYSLIEKKKLYFLSTIATKLKFIIGTCYQNYLNIFLLFQLQIVSTLRRAASILHFSPAQHKCFPQLPRASKLETANISSRKARVRKILPASATRISPPTFTHRYLWKLSYSIKWGHNKSPMHCNGWTNTPKSWFVTFLDRQWDSHHQIHFVQT